MTALSLRQIYLDDKYFVMHSIGSGHFGDIRVAKNIDTSEIFAVKLEESMRYSSKLKNEYEMYSRISEFVDKLKDTGQNAEEESIYGFPKIYSFGTYENYNYLIMDLLGYNLEALFNACNRKFSLKCVVMIGLQILERLEVVHSCNIIFQDIKPENFVIGRETTDRGRLIYMLDFGLAKEIDDQISSPSVKKIIGTSRYMSVNAHKGLEQSRRDDLESFLYVLIYFLKGSLPWQGINTTEMYEKHQKVLKIKSNIKHSKLCKGLPNGFTKILGYVKLLKFEEIPNYKFLHDILNEILATRMETCDWKFDWLSKNYLVKSSLETFYDENVDIDAIIKSDELFCRNYGSVIFSCCGLLKKKEKS